MKAFLLSSWNQTRTVKDAMHTHNFHAPLHLFSICSSFIFSSPLFPILSFRFGHHLFCGPPPSHDPYTSVQGMQSPMDPSGMAAAAAAAGMAAAASAAYNPMNAVRSPHLLPHHAGHPHAATAAAAAMMMGHPSMGHPGLPTQTSPYDATSAGHIMDIHAN